MQCEVFHVSCGLIDFCSGQSVGFKLCHQSSAAMQPPTGFVPLVAFKRCPPKGVFFELFLYLLDSVNDVYQVCTFIFGAQYFFAAFTAAFVLLSSVMAANAVNFSFVELVTEAIRTARRGAPTDTWKSIFFCEQNIEAPGTGLIAPYGLALLSTISPLTFLSAAYGLLSSAKAMASGRLSLESGDHPMALAAIRPTAFMAMKAWLMVAFLAELAGFAIVSSVCHPAVALATYLAAACVSGIAAPEDKIFVCLQNLAFPNGAMLGNATRTLVSGSGQYAGCGLLEGLFVLLRLGLWASLCFAELPQGVAPWGALARPMGRVVLEEQFIRPSLAVFEAVQDCANHHCAWPELEHLSTSSAMYRMLLLGTFSICGAVHALVVVGQLLLNPTYRSAEPNVELDKEMQTMINEIEKYSDKRECNYEEMALE
ncbi:unnamed protein product [Effrenium voratum]|uniref:Uncharacterized protein n=1 Tax=Effrenium voratum TaxID=2562239 RepID=A0AA36J435_9DINO|nr:unnamed protein product [Effrenium voratum]CAJ1449947.1 unnamed protein product [Effrenium voratum]